MARWNYLDHPFLRWYYPELALCRTQFERMEASTRGRASAPAFSIRLLAPILIFTAFAVIVPVIYMTARPYWLPMWTMSPVITAAMFLFLFVMMMLVREHARRGIRVFLLERGIALCLECGYDLRGLDAETACCPECGGKVDEQAAALLRSAQEPERAQ